MGQNNKHHHRTTHPDYCGPRIHPPRHTPPPPPPEPVEIPDTLMPGVCDATARSITLSQEMEELNEVSTWGSYNPAIGEMELEPEKKIEVELGNQTIASSTSGSPLTPRSNEVLAELRNELIIGHMYNNVSFSAEFSPESTAEGGEEHEKEQERTKDGGKEVNSEAPDTEAELHSVAADRESQQTRGCTRLLESGALTLELLPYLTSKYEGIRAPPEPKDTPVPARGPERRPLPLPNCPRPTVEVLPIKNLTITGERQVDQRDQKDHRQRSGL